MPGRDITFANNGIYHIYNRTTDKSKIFRDENLSYLFLDILKYYRSTKANLRYSNYKNLEAEMQEYYDRKLLMKKFHEIELYCFSIMPTHYHLLLKQKIKGGVSGYISKIMNSFTKYYNIKYEHFGQLFMSPFRAVQVFTREQFIHVSRYIHLNYYSSGLINDIDDLFNFPFSSLPRYMNVQEDDLIDKSYLLSMFNNSPLRYREFVENNADYQKSLERLKYAEKWV